MPAGAAHDRPLDLLVPAALRAAEYLFVIAAGVAFDVPAWGTFLLLFALALWHYDLTARLEKRETGGWLQRWGLGWDGRVPGARPRLCVRAGRGHDGYDRFLPLVYLLVGQCDLVAESGGGGSPLISFIVPVFNVRSYLRQCLDSILEDQSVPIELIAIDDRSTDGSADILAEYAARVTPGSPC